MLGIEINSTTKRSKKSYQYNELFLKNNAKIKIISTRINDWKIGKSKDPIMIVNKLDFEFTKVSKKPRDWALATKKVALDKTLDKNSIIADPVRRNMK